MISQENSPVKISSKFITILPISKVRNPLMLDNDLPPCREKSFSVQQIDYKKEMENRQSEYAAYNNIIQRNLRIDDINSRNRKNINKSMDLSLITHDLDQKQLKTIVKPYEFGEPYRELSMRKYKLKPRNRDVSLDLSTKDIKGAIPKQIKFSSLSRNILTTDDIFGAQSDTLKLPNVTKILNK